jgi:hypothetical protein
MWQIPLVRWTFQFSALMLLALASSAPAGPVTTQPSSNNPKRPANLPNSGIPSEGVQIGGAPSPITTPTQPSTSPDSRSTHDTRLVRFQLPEVGIPPSNRPIGGTRTVSEPLTLCAISPDDVGLTRQPAPCLFWYISRPTGHRIEFAINRPTVIEPVLYLPQLQTQGSSGICRLDLAAHGVKLQPGIVYEWVVAVVQDEGRRSHDVVATGSIKFVDGALVTLKSGAGVATLVSYPVHPNGSLRPSADPRERAVESAEDGIWYDAFQAVSDAVEASPFDESARVQRAAFLEDIGLGKIAVPSSTPTAK